MKPANLLMGADGQVRLSDFGIALPVAQAAHTVEEANHKAFQRGRVGRPTGGFHKARMVRSGQRVGAKRGRASTVLQRLTAYKSSCHIVQQHRFCLLQRTVQPIHPCTFQQMGTLQYMAPEVLLKEPTSPASDVYAFGVTLNELATGIIPFSDCTKVRALRLQRTQPERRPRQLQRSAAAIAEPSPSPLTSLCKACCLSAPWSMLCAFGWRCASVTFAGQPRGAHGAGDGLWPTGAGHCSGCRGPQVRTQQPLICEFQTHVAGSVQCTCCMLCMTETQPLRPQPRPTTSCSSGVFMTALGTPVPLATLPHLPARPITQAPAAARAPTWL